MCNPISFLDAIRARILGLCVGVLGTKTVEKERRLFRNRSVTKGADAGKSYSAVRGVSNMPRDGSQVCWISELDDGRKYCLRIRADKSFRGS